MAWFASVGATGCGAPGADSDTESACARSSRLQEVELYDGSFGVTTAFVARHRRAVGLLRWKSDLAVRYPKPGTVNGQAWCTGTLIGENLFLTAAHCFDYADAGTWQLPKERGGVNLTTPALAREFVVDFRYEISLQPELAVAGESVEVVDLVEYRNKNLDYAIVKLAGNPGSRNGVARVSPVDASPRSPIAILQHPAGESMKVGAGSVASVQGAKISYDTIDTAPGSSGSGILDATTGKLVGVHTNGGCSKHGGGQNYGVTIGALRAASPTLQALADRSRDFYVGDWNNDGYSDLAVFYNGCLYPDANHDAEGTPDPELIECAPLPAAEEYFVGRWVKGQPTRLGWRRGGCVYLDTNPNQPLCFADDSHLQIVVADWNGDGASDLGVLRGNCIDFDTNLDGTPDVISYCYGKGLSEDEYLAGDWDGSGRDSIAVRRGNAFLVDADRDGKPDPDRTRVYGGGGTEDQYFFGDWTGAGQGNLALRRGGICLMNYDADDSNAEEGRIVQDFWSRK